MYLELYLVAVEFLILEGDNLEKLFPIKGLKLAGLKFGGKQGFVLITAFMILPTTWLRSLGSLAYVSFGGVLASIVVVCSVFWSGAVDGVGFHQRGILLSWGGMPTSISLFTFCYCGHAVFPTLCNSMKDKSQFHKVLLSIISTQKTIELSWYFHINFVVVSFRDFLTSTTVRKVRKLGTNL